MTRTIDPSPALSRRTFVKGVALGSAAAALGWWPSNAWAAGPVRQPQGVLSGTEFDLRIGETDVNVTGRARTALTINGSLPGPMLRWREGDTVTLRVTNMLNEETSLHWHGILVPANMDGVPGMSFHGIHPRETYEYRFRVRQSGTYWYHSHSGFQEQQGVYGPLVIEARESTSVRADREHVVMLTDWSDESPNAMLGHLKKESSYYNYRRRTLVDFVRDVRRNGLGATLSERSMWGRMRMSASDVADVTGATYTYLMNGQPPAANWTGLFAPGERVLLRFINGSAMSYFDVRIPGMVMTVVAADGQPVQPVTVDEFRMSVAETYDVLVEPNGAEAFTIFAQAMDRTGFAVGTLATREGARAEVPPLDPRPVLSMADMGHAMPATTGADPHAGHDMPPPSAAGDASEGHDMASMPGHDMASMEVHDMASMPGHDMSSMAGHDMAAMVDSGQTHPASERGNPLVDMQAMAPTSKLNDPGIGLRGNGRRVLTYGQLRSAFADPDGREPSRTIELHLTGHMDRFSWSFSGVKFSSADPIRLVYGERVRIVLVNDTMMSHPIHLHGMWSDLEDDMGAFLVRKHTFDMPPGSRRTYRVTADALGRWAYHCHLMFHMTTGMMREVRVEEAS